MKQLITIVLALAMILSACSFVFAADEFDEQFLSGTPLLGVAPLPGDELLDILIAPNPDAEPVVIEPEIEKTVKPLVADGALVAGEAKAFTDLTEADAWAKEAIDYLSANGIVGGTSEGLTFEPAAYFTRAQIVTMLWKLQGQPYVNYAMNFKDVKEGEWYSEAVRWAAAEKIVNGNDKNEFMPDEIITREMLATVIYQYAEQLGHGFHGAWVFLLSYADRAEIAEWADTGVHYAAVHQLFNIEDGANFEPQAQVTRAEAAYAFYQLIKPVEE